MTKSGKQIRQEFIDFFKQRKHTFVPSSSLLPADDPTLLFANAGMNQFKPIFLGTETRDYTRATNTQKCIRAGGKHNDLEDVGRDCYHHTFFEMLGNWSFGDYFKKEAIDWAWKLLTDVWGLDANRLHATYFEGCADDNLEPDTEARDLWLQYLPADRVHPGNKKDNFWEMGETGPCGPCSELHIDLTPDLSGGPLVNAGSPQVIEIWNLVFIQFNRDSNGTLSPLPAKHVDTGMGLERVAAVMQGKRSNYATDLFRGIFEAIETMTDHRYGQEVNPDDRWDAMDESNLADVAMRVIADHARTLTFAIADGILPSNKDRGAVLRAILRRAAGFGRNYLNIQGTFLHKLVPVIVDMFGDAFAELKDRADYVTQTILSEEDAFGKTLDRGLELFNRQAEKIQRDGGDTIDAAISFELHATYGFPFSLTKLMAEKRGLKVDDAGHIEMMEEHRSASRGEGGKFKTEAVIGLPETDDSAKYKGTFADACVLGWVIGEQFITDGTLAEGEKAAIVLDRTSFYGESGGQVGDEGTLLTTDGSGVVFHVSDTKLAGSCVLHFGELLKGELEIGQEMHVEVDENVRRATVRNHSATHLLNWALRKVLGENVNQAGSVVDPQRLRFDFTHNEAMTAEQIADVERWVNDKILADQPITIDFRPLDQAKEIPGVRAMFGEKYPDPVRVVAMGPATLEAATENDTVEFCGGIHLDRTSQAGLFKIVSEESVAKGVRRITAVTGRAAVQWVQSADATLTTAAQTLRIKPEELPARIEAMQKEIKKLKKRPAAAAGGGGLTDENTFDTAAGKVVVAKVPALDAGLMRNLCDQQRQKGAVAVFLGAADEEEGKVMLIAMCSDEVIKAGQIKAGDWVKQIAPVVGGGGGGKPNLAQAGGKQPAKLGEALVAAAEFAKSQLG